MTYEWKTLSTRTINYRGTEYEVTVYDRGLDDRPALFVHGEPRPTMKRPDSYLDDKAWKAYNREEIRIMRWFIDAVSDLLPFETDSKSLPFSRKAGCQMCSCSPGFRLGPVRSIGNSYEISIEKVMA